MNLTKIEIYKPIYSIVWKGYKGTPEQDNGDYFIYYIPFKVPLGELTSFLVSTSFED